MMAKSETSAVGADVLKAHDPISILESQIASLKEEAAQLRVHISELKQTLIDRDGELAIADEILFVRRQQLDGLTYELAQREQVIETILDSWFWRLTLTRQMPKRDSIDVRRILRLDRKGPATVEPPLVDGPPISRRMRYVHRVTDRIDATKLDIKAIAFYAPKLGSIHASHQSRTDLATEWIKVANGLPRYLGHNQPRLVDDLGFYDPSEPGVMRKQIELAQQYGIFGFCFYHYWADGRHELEGTLREFLSDNSLDIKFCLCWMNEKQKGAASDSAFMSPLMPALSDPRYLRIDGKPILIVARPGLLQDAAASVQRWRDFANKSGLPGMYLVAAIEPDAMDARSAGFDARMEFPPSQYTLRDVTIQHSLIDSNFKGHIFSYEEVVDNSSALEDSSLVTFRTVIPGWDQEAVRPGLGDSLAGANTALFAKWLKQSCEKTVLHRPEERLIFINAWNAWSDGAYMEPDRKFGYAYLHTAANILRSYHNDPETEKLIEDLNARFKRTNDAAIVFHCHYEDLVAPVFDQYLSRIKNADLFITVRNDITRAAVEEVYRRFPKVFFVCAENRGRDVRPFLLALRQLKAHGYPIACKVHSKKTPHSEVRTGDQWRELLMGPLLGSEHSVAEAARIFAEESDVGLLAPEGSVLDLRVPHVHLRHTYWLDRLLYRMGRRDLIGNYAWEFAAGSMYWFRLAALDGIDDWLLEDDAFEPELGQADGTLHHAVERLVSLYALGRGFKTKEVSFEVTELSKKTLHQPKEKPPADVSSSPRMARPEFVAESIQKQRTLIRTLEAQLKKKERDLANETWVLDQLKRSWSWRMTAPLRLAARLARAVAKRRHTPEVGKGPDMVEFGILKDLKALHTAPSNVYLQFFLSSGARLNFRKQKAPEVSVIFLMNDQTDTALTCLRSLESEQKCSIEVIVIDAASSHEGRTLIERLDGVQVIRSHKEAGIPEAINAAGRVAHAEYILLLLNGARQLMPGALDAALSTIRSSADIGAVGGRLIHVDGSLEEAGNIVWRDGSCLPYGRGDDPFGPSYMFRRNVDYSSSAFLLTPRHTFQRLGGYVDMLAAYEDADYCTRIWESGMRVVYDPNAVVLHEDLPATRKTTEFLAAQQDVFRGRHDQHLTKQLAASPHLILKARSVERRRSILFLEDRVPHRWFGAGLPRAHTILETLLQHFLVTFYPLMTYQEEWSTVYTDIPPEVEVILDFGPARLEEFLLQRRDYYDTILVSRPHNMEFLHPVLKKHPGWFEGVNVVYDAEALFAIRDIELRKLAGYPMSESESTAAIRAEIDMARAADTVISVSEAERNMFTKNGIHVVHVLGHAIKPEPTPQHFEEREGFLFVGSMRKATPNVDSVIWFLEEIFPLIQARLGKDVSVTIAGVCDSEHIRNLASSTVRVVGAVNDLREHYNRARVFIAPTRYAAGIPHKVHEAAAHGLPSVVTPLLAAQLGWTDGCEISVAGNTKRFAERCSRLYEQKDEWQRVRQNALERVEKECSVKAFQEKLAVIVGNPGRSS